MTTILMRLSLELYCVQDYLDYGNPWALGALTFASVGLLMTTILMRLSLALCVCRTIWTTGTPGRWVPSLLPLSVF
jgi:hypothetical protein